MLKRLLDVMGTVEGGRRARRTRGESRAGGPANARDPVPGTVVDHGSARDFSAAYAYAISEGIGEERASLLSSAYAESIAQGNSSAYSIVYAAAYSIACTIIGAPEEWARSYAQACGRAVTGGESIGFASMYGHAVADGASPHDALAFARRYAA